MQITVSGQLSITMLIEDLVLQIPNCKILMVNTDGLEVIIRRDQQELYYDICKRWEEKTKLTLEFDDYQKMVIGDVNNYLALYTNGKKKYKGRFEIDKVVGDEPAYHKDNSFRIVPYALSKFFLENIPVEKTIKEHTNIYDFCGRQKFKGQDYGETCELIYLKRDLPINEYLKILKDRGFSETYNKLWKKDTYDYSSARPLEDLINSLKEEAYFNKVEKQQRNTRFYITTEGSTFIKRYGKGTSEMICKGYQVKIFNRYEEKLMNDYKIDYQFYIKECYKEINNIISKQTTLNF
jgi:hypothetical protein